MPLVQETLKGCIGFLAVQEARKHCFELIRLVSFLRCWQFLILAALEEVRGPACYLVLVEDATFMPLLVSTGRPLLRVRHEAVVWCDAPCGLESDVRSPRGSEESLMLVEILLGLSMLRLAQELTEES